MQKLITAVAIVSAGMLTLTGCATASDSEELVIQDVTIPGDSASGGEPIVGPDVVEEVDDRNKSDGEFVTTMLPHAYQGIEIHIHADRNAEDPRVLRFASSQTSAFESQIALYEKYFFEWSLPNYPAPTGAGEAEGAYHAPNIGNSEDPQFRLVHGGDGVPHVDNDYLVDEGVIYQEGYEPDGLRLMDSMLSDVEMIALFNVRGKEFDILWLEMIIKLNEGAIEIAQTHQESGVHSTLLELSKKIIADREYENSEMARWLNELKGA